MAGLLFFSIYGTITPSGLRCELPGRVACVGGLVGAQVPDVTTANSQWFAITMYDYGFWIVDTVSGANESTAWIIFEGFTVHVNATSTPADSSVGGTAYHGIGVELNKTGQQLLSLDAPVGRWSSGSFVAPSQAYSRQHIWCTIECGPGHGGMQLSNLYVEPSTIVPMTSASANRTAGIAPFAVALTGSVHGGVAPITTSWNFGDGSPAASTANATHTYTVAGNYSATFTATDAHGATSTSSVALKVVPDSPLTATLGGLPASGYAPLLVALRATASGGLAPYSYSWAFGDGGTAAGPAVSHFYGAVGVFGATLSVVDSAGHSARAQASITIRSPTGSLVVSTTMSPTAGTAPATIAFTAVSTGGTAPYTYAWILGDGNVGWGAAVTHVYGATGDYEVTVFATDSAGRVGTNVTGLPIAGPSGTPIGGVLTLTPSSGSPPLRVTASYSVYGGSGSYTAIAWSFGDGTTASGPRASHTYGRLGTFTLSASATDSSGSPVRTTTTVNVVGVGIVVTADRIVGDAPFSVSVVASIQGGSGTYGTVQWDWGDGTTSQGTPGNHTYAPNVTGAISIRATVADSSGNRTSNSTLVHIFPEPVARLSDVVGTSVGFPKTVTFTLEVSGGSGNYSASPLWSFGDGSTTRGASPQTHTYQRPGNYRAVATTNDSLGTLITPGAWVNLSLGAVGGTPGGSQGWVFNGVANPDQAALVLVGVVSISGLLMLQRNRSRKAAKAPAATPTRGPPRPAPDPPKGAARRP